MNLEMDIEAYKTRIYQETALYPKKYNRQDPLSLLETLGKWGTRLRHPEPIFEENKLYSIHLNRSCKNLKDLIELSKSQILQYVNFGFKYKSSITAYIRIIKSKSPINTRADALHGFEVRYTEMCYNYMVYILLAQFLLVGGDSSWKKGKSRARDLAFISDFDERIYRYFNQSKIADRHILLAKDFYYLLHNEKPDLLSDVIHYLKDAKGILNIFQDEWPTTLERVCSSVTISLFHRADEDNHTAIFMEAVNNKYPEEDFTIHKGGGSNPAEIYIRYGRSEDRVDMLLALMKEKKDDPYLEKYVRDLLSSIHKHDIKIHTPTRLQINYFQALYERIVKSNSLSDLQIFDTCFSIKKNVVSPWSPLFSFSELRKEILEYCITVGVDLNLESGILGREIASSKLFTSLFEFNTKTKALEYLTSKGMELQDPGFYYMIAIENKDTDLLKFIMERTPIDVDDDFPLRVALFEQNLSICYFIISYYKSEGVYDKLEKFCKISGFPSNSRETAKRILKEHSIMES